MNDDKPIQFDDVSRAHLEKYLRHAVEIVLKREARAKYTHDKHGKPLPKIMISPPDENVLKAGKKKTITKIVDTKTELSPKLKKQIDSEHTHKVERLKKRYESRITDLQEHIVALETQITTVLGELDAYANGTHPHFANHTSREDLESEISALEHKLLHFAKKSENYHQLGERLTTAKGRLDSLDV